MKINLKVRIKNKMFWLAAVPAVLLIVQSAAAMFGYEWDFVILNRQSAAVINSVFSLLAVLGVVQDPTTEGLADSENALTYRKPKSKKGKETE